ncbi:hypothetical protein F53441_13299 [Fusarium austroafricanum]|uniref:Uncharacterized protein n=1 Tax=Fusarium austroafricanum TaxID=2364996 RepID=A0A8H4JNY8_9HYPO|nr:hypothetical protein F53441_13299 [Fusarium austroafricanum]
MNMLRSRTAYHFLRLVGLVGFDSSIDVLKQWKDFRGQVPKSCMEIWKNINILAPVFRDKRERTWNILKPYIGAVYQDNCMAQFGVMFGPINEYGIKYGFYPDEWPFAHCYFNPFTKRKIRGTHSEARGLVIVHTDRSNMGPHNPFEPARFAFLPTTQIPLI